MQPPDIRRAVADRLEHPHQDGHRVDPAHRIAALQHVVEERRVHPLEQPDIEQELPVLRPEPGPASPSAGRFPKTGGATPSISCRAPASTTARRSPPRTSPSRSPSSRNTTPSGSPCSMPSRRWTPPTRTGCPSRIPRSCSRSSRCRCRSSRSTSSATAAIQDPPRERGPGRLRTLRVQAVAEGPARDPTAKQGAEACEAAAGPSAASALNPFPAENQCPTRCRPVVCAAISAVGSRLRRPRRPPRFRTGTGGTRWARNRSSGPRPLSGRRTHS